MYAEQETDALELKIYRGADCSCVYYQDDGTTCAYERGELEEIRFYWDDAREELTIHEIRNFRTQPVRMIIRMEQYETIIRYDGGEKRLSLRE